MKSPGETLQLPRRLAIQLLAHAQKLAPGAPLQGALYGSAPPTLKFRPGEVPKGAAVWAWVAAQPESGEPASAADGRGRVMTIGLDTKGVLQLRCWEPDGPRMRERDLQISG